MKRHLLTLAGCLLWTLVSVAASRSAEEAAEIAGRFAANQDRPVAQRMQCAKMSSSAVQPMRLVYTQAQLDNAPALYVFNSETADGGFVVVSAEDNARTILGYADSGHFTETEMPANMRFWLQMYADEIARAAQAPVSAAQTGDDTAYPAVSPLLGTIAWGQDEPYNNLCPSKDGVQCVTGCVATAASQIMYYHRYPAKGTGAHSYTWNNQTLSANFGNTTYDWTNMLPVYSGTNYSTTQANAVATLMSHVGIACNMGYNTNANGGSGAVSNSALQALIHYFGYDAAIRVLPKDYMDESEMLGAIASDLQAGHPIFMSGRTTQNEGHAFVLDGMQSNGYVHINWGWDGYYHGYFALSAMNPYGQGTGGAASGKGFTESVCAFTGIQPDQGGDSIPCIIADTVRCISQRRVGINDDLAFSINPFQNSGVTTSKGNVTYIIYKDGQCYAKMPINATYNLLPGYYYIDPYIVYRGVSGLPAGEYELSLGVLPDNSTTAYPILTKMARGERRFPLTVTADSVFLGEGNINQDDKADLNFADAYIFDYTDGYGVNFLQVELHTADYKTQDNAVAAGTALQLGLIPADRSSIVGTYIWGNGIDAGTLYSDNGLTSINYACNGVAYSDILNSGVVTVTIDSLGNYVFAIELAGNKTTYTTTCSLSEDNLLIGRYDAADGGLYYSALENKTITSLSVAEAKNRITALPNGNATSVPYLVRGIVSQMVNTPAEIAQYGSARFYISDDGTTTGQLYCYNQWWLGNRRFSTGEELAVGDTVVMSSPLLYYNAYLPELSKGYIYYHAAKPEEHKFAIRVHISETSGLDTSKGLYLHYLVGSNLYSVVPQSEGNGWWRANLTLAADSIECVLSNTDGTQQTNYSPKFSYGSTCLLMGETSNADDGTNNYWNLYIGECDAFTSAYLPSDLQVSVSLAGADFTWDSPSETNYEVRLQQVGSDRYTTYYSENKNLGLIFTGAYTFGWQVRAVNDELVPISDFVQGENFTTLENPYIPANLSATTHDSTTYYFSWDATVAAPQYRIRIVLGGKVYYYVDVEAVPVSLTFDIDGYYSWQVYALDAEGNTMGFANGGSFKVAGVPDYTISNLQVACNGTTAIASWESHAPKYLVSCSNRQDTIIDTRYYRVTNLEDGEYTLEVTPVDRYERYIIGDEQTTAFTINAAAQPKEYQLTIAGLYGGNVNAEVNGIYPAGTEVQIVATPNTGYRFRRWSDDNTDAVRTIVLTDNLTLIASFEEITTYQITIMEAQGGITNPPAGIYSCSNGDLLAVSAHPDENHTFCHWLIDGVQADGNPLLHKVTSAVHISPVFSEKEAPQLYYTLTLAAGEGGSVSARPWLDKYLAGTTISIEATPDAGYLFERWSDGYTNSKRTVVISSDTTLTASFYKQPTAMHNALNSNTIRVIEHTVEVQTTDYTTIYLTDLSGRIIARVRNTRYARFNVPEAGVYIVRCGGEAMKILIQ